MRAVWYERTGPAEDVLVLGEQPTPSPGPGEVRIRLAASGVNPADCNRRGGRGYVMEAPLVIPHSDGAGIVDMVGAGVPDEWRGARVWLYNGQRGRPLGTAAAYIALDVDLVTRLPDSVSFEVGACLGIPCMTAHRAVFAGGPVQGRTLLVTGGGGAVGNYAVQLAKWAGAHVLATASSEQTATDARTAGADLVFNYRTDNIIQVIADATGGWGVDHIVEVDFGGNLASLPDLIALNGTVATYASRGDLNPSFPFYALMRKNIGIQLVYLANAPLEARRLAQADITQWLTEGERLHRFTTYALEQTAAAHAAVEAGAKRGTVVIRIS